MSHMRSKTKTIGGVFLIAAILLWSQVFADANALYKATEEGDVDTVKSLIEKGTDVNERNRFGSFALNSAAVKNNLELLRYFIDSGANVNVQNWSGDTPLICATKYAGGKEETVKLLLDAGTDVSLKDEDGKTAMDYARDKEQAEAIALLEKAG